MIAAFSNIYSQDLYPYFCQYTCTFRQSWVVQLFKHRTSSTPWYQHFFAIMKKQIAFNNSCCLMVPNCRFFLSGITRIIKVSPLCIVDFWYPRFAYISGLSRWVVPQIPITDVALWRSFRGVFLCLSNPWWWRTKDIPI